MSAMQAGAIDSSLHLSGRCVLRSALSEAQRDAMYELLCDHFEGVTRGVFENDLAEKEWAVLLEDAEGRIRGFSTFHIYAERGVDGEAVAIVYSGDTIVDRSAWGTPTLPRCWIHSVYEVHRSRFSGARLFWLLIASGFRTYRFLPVFWKEFYPRYDAAIPPDQAEWLVRVARDRFGAAYDAAAGIVRLSSPQPLRGELREIPMEKLSDPHVAFFIQRNPGHVNGDELVCLAELSPENLTAAGRRMVYGSGSRRGV